MIPTAATLWRFRRVRNALGMFHGDKAHHVQTTCVFLAREIFFSFAAQIIEKRHFAITQAMIKNDLTHSLLYCR